MGGVLSQICQAHSHTLTSVLIAHTCISSAPSSSWLYKHTPHATPVSGLVHLKWILSVTKTEYQYSYLLCVLQRSTPACLLPSLCVDITLNGYTEVCAVICPPSVSSAISCKNKSFITFLIKTVNYIKPFLPFLPGASVAFNKSNLFHSNPLCESPYVTIGLFINTV